MRTLDPAQCVGTVPCSGDILILLGLRILVCRPTYDISIVFNSHFKEQREELLLLSAGNKMIFAHWDMKEWAGYFCWCWWNNCSGSHLLSKASVLWDPALSLLSLAGDLAVAWHLADPAVQLRDYRPPRVSAMWSRLSPTHSCWPQNLTAAIHCVQSCISSRESF